MINRLIGPAIGPAFLFAVTSVIGKFGKERYGAEQVLEVANWGRRFAIWLGILAYLRFWHREIGYAWIDYPTAASTMFVVLAAVVYALLIAVRHPASESHP